jgi:hypothetical protein
MVRPPTPISQVPHLRPFTGTVAPIEREVRELAIGLQAVKDEQEYIVIRERVHRNTAESTNERVKWWSIAQAIVLVAVCGFQVYYLQVSKVSTFSPFPFASRLGRVLTRAAVVFRGQTSDLVFEWNIIWSRVPHHELFSVRPGKSRRQERLIRSVSADSQGLFYL